MKIFMLLNRYWNSVRRNRTIKFSRSNYGEVAFEICWMQPFHFYRLNICLRCSVKVFILHKEIQMRYRCRLFLFNIFGSFSVDYLWKYCLSYFNISIFHDFTYNSRNKTLLNRLVPEEINIELVIRNLLNSISPKLKIDISNTTSPSRLLR